MSRKTSKILWVLLAVIGVLVLGSCGVEKNVRKDGEGRILIGSVQELELLRKYPRKTFCLDANIDLGGADWTPVPTFSGELSGVWGGEFYYTISNFKLKAENDSNTGFFGELTGTVRELNFENVMLEFTASSGSEQETAGIVAGNSSGTMTNVAVKDSSLIGNAGNRAVGLLAGKNTGSVSFVSVSGKVDLTAEDGASIGSVIGSADGLSNAESRAVMTVNAENKQIRVGGICGTAEKNATELNFMGKLSVTCGEESEAAVVAGHSEKTLSNVYDNSTERKILIAGEEAENIFTGNGGKTENAFQRDRAALDENLPGEELSRRKRVVDYMYRECTIPWTPYKTMSYQDNKGGHQQTYYEGEWYFGMPYVAECGSLERFTNHIDENHRVLSTVPTDLTYKYFLGNDCADAVYWAWARISAEITYTLTANMINCNGTYPVGDYDETVSYESTAEVCAKNGPEKIYESYAKLHMGDAVLFGPGHVRMVAEAPFVYRDSDGKILPDVSYVLIHEQGGRVSDCAESHSTCNAFKKIPFVNLFKKNYIPVTIKAFTEGEDEPEVTTTNTKKNADGVMVGILNSNYRLNEVAVSITDENGNEVAGTKIFPGKGGHVDSLNLALYKKDVKLSELPAGKYHYLVKSRVSDDYVTVDEFDFEK